MDRVLLARASAGQVRLDVRREPGAMRRRPSSPRRRWSSRPSVGGPSVEPALVEPVETVLMRSFCEVDDRTDSSASITAAGRSIRVSLKVADVRSTRSSEARRRSARVRSASRTAAPSSRASVSTRR